MLGIFKTFTKGLQKTASGLGGLFAPGRVLSAEDINQLEEALYSADMGVHTADEILEAIRTAAKKDKALKGEAAAAIGKTIVTRVLQGEGEAKNSAQRAPWQPRKDGKPTVVSLVGINGSGKTTTAAKLAAQFTGAGHSVVLGACDTYRAAAAEQLTVWANRLNVPIVSSQRGADAAAVAFDTLQSATAKGADVCLIDTAGRLHNKAGLMEELKKIGRVLKKIDAGAPHETWLVLDAHLGTNSVQQARLFHEALGLTGLILTKLDGTARGGALVSIYRELQLPIMYVGFGEGVEDLKHFESEPYAAGLFEG